MGTRRCWWGGDCWLDCSVRIGKLDRQLPTAQSIVANLVKRNLQLPLPYVSDWKMERGVTNCLQTTFQLTLALITGSQWIQLKMHTISKVSIYQKPTLIFILLKSKL
jgi:hypothetical protein